MAAIGIETCEGGVESKQWRKRSESIVIMMAEIGESENNGGGENGERKNQ